MDYRMTPSEEDILLYAAQISARIYHRSRADSNKRYKPKPNHDGPEALHLRTLVLLSRRARDTPAPTA